MRLRIKRKGGLHFIVFGIHSMWMFPYSVWSSLIRVQDVKNADFNVYSEIVT